MDISAWVKHWASWTPDKTALRFDGRSLSYAEVEHRVRTAAGWLHADGVSAGDRVAYLGPSCPELLELLFACARLGAVFVPLNIKMPAAELRVFTTLSHPRLLIAENGFLDIAAASVQVAGGGRVREFSAGDGLADGAAEPLPAGAGVDAGAPALVLFTSGTTGPPKGATFTHQNLIFNALNVITGVRLTAVEEILTAVPMFHTSGLFINTLPGLCAGATITIHSDFDAGRVLEEVGRQQITLLACAPAMTFALAEHPGWAQADLSSLRYVFTGSTTVTAKAIEPWHAKGVVIGQGYGSTEACPTATMMPPGSPPGAAYTAGKPALYTELRIADDTGTALATGQPGEVWFRGPAVMRGYWDNEPATREVFCDGWLRSGDLGVIDECGYLHIVGRIKDMIIVGSANVYPGDLEAVLDDCPEVREAAVVDRPDAELGEVPVACVVPVPGHALTGERVLALFEGRLAAYKHPREVIFLDNLPRNWHGKVDRRRLREIVKQPRALTKTHSMCERAPQFAARPGRSGER